MILRLEICGFCQERGCRVYVERCGWRWRLYFMWKPFVPAQTRQQLNANTLPRFCQDIILEIDDTVQGRFLGNSSRRGLCSLKINTTVLGSSIQELYIVETPEPTATEFSFFAFFTCEHEKRNDDDYKCGLIIFVVCFLHANDHLLTGWSRSRCSRSERHSQYQRR
jgi:hypothetical protein